MNFTRRDFIKIGGISALGAGILSTDPLNVFGQSFSKYASAETDLLFSLDAGAFTKMIGKTFTFFTTESASQGTLSEVVVKTTKESKKNLRSLVRKSATTDCFFLIFKVQSPNLLQDTYTVNQAQIGQFDLFLVPGSTNADSTNLIATINRL